jgi:crotonobetainyl-CoA:carnitine CoA-transferase CaiB-like acyl-CoA transferase
MAGALDGVTVLDLSAVISGPMACAMLADQGARVIKVEGFEGDVARWLGPRKGDISSMFLAANRGKEAIALNLKTPEGVAILKELIGKADVLVQNFRPGAMERLGLGYETCAGLNPRLIYCSISGYGSQGPYSGARVYDPIIQATSGIASTQRDVATGQPVLLQSLICDKLSALTAAQAITAALFAREKSGAGQHVELAMLDAAIHFLWPESMYNHTFLDDPPPPQPDFGSFYRLIPTKDGWLTTAGVQDGEFRAMVKALGREDLADDPRFSTIMGRMQNAAAFRDIAGPLFMSRTAAEHHAAMLETDAPAAKVNERPELMTDPQVLANKVIQEVDAGPIGRARLSRAPAVFSGTPARAPSAAPRIGENTLAILSELGRTGDAAAAVIASGAARAAP